tara:strand:+ start:115 stop:354 length:240 start_codon:yes stop_codon:yes gene_type:complete
MDKEITVSGWNGDERMTLNSYLKLWVNNAELTKLWSDNKSLDMIIDIQNKIKEVAERNFNYLYEKQQDPNNNKIGNNPS